MSGEERIGCCEKKKKEKKKHACIRYQKNVSSNIVIRVEELSLRGHP